MPNRRGERYGSSNVTSPFYKEAKVKVLILGNRGQIGSYLEEFLLAKGFEVTGLDIASDSSQDLRYMTPNILDSYVGDSDFVFFLAYDVGGSTYLQTRQSSFDFLHNNLLIMASCFASLDRMKTPFIFASSQMSNMFSSNYGLLKAIGERFTQSLAGISVKFWNVYGYETNRDKFHVISDFIRMAVEEGEIRMKTTGEESRDFLFAQDCCEGLFGMMNNYSFLEKNTTYDLATGTWVSILKIAEIIAKELNVPILRGDERDSLQNAILNEPDLKKITFWKATTTIEEGISQIINDVLSSRS